MTANVLIDGYNLYYGLLKGTPYKWLDLWAFARALLKEGIELQSVKYFTAQIKTHPHDQAAIDRQKIYLQALAAQGKVQVISGFLSYQYLQDFICVGGFLVGFSLISSQRFDMLTPDKSQ